MPAENPLYLLSAFAGMPAIPPENFALKRAQQRMSKFIDHMASITKGGPSAIDPAVVTDTVADANCTLRAIEYAFSEIIKYEAIRLHPEEKNKVVGCRRILEGFKESALYP
jgi:hypothetical protein